MYEGSIVVGEFKFFVFDVFYDFISNDDNEVVVQISYVEDDNVMNDVVMINYEWLEGGMVVMVFDVWQYNFGVVGQMQFCEIILLANMEDYEQLLLYFFVDCLGIGCDFWDQFVSIFIDML